MLNPTIWKQLLNFMIWHTTLACSTEMFYSFINTQWLVTLKVTSNKTWQAVNSSVSENNQTQITSEMISNIKQ